jgi:hypothetical protein
MGKFVFKVNKKMPLTKGDFDLVIPYLVISNFDINEDLDENTIDNANTPEKEKEIWEAIRSTFLDTEKQNNSDNWVVKEKVVTTYLENNGNLKELWEQLLNENSISISKDMIKDMISDIAFE